MLQSEAAVPVRRQLAELLEAAIGARPCLALLAVIASTLADLLHDAASSVVKRAVLASAIAFRCSAFPPQDPCAGQCMQAMPSQLHGSCTRRICSRSECPQDEACMLHTGLGLQQR